MAGEGVGGKEEEVGRQEGYGYVVGGRVTRWDEHTRYTREDGWYLVKDEGEREVVLRTGRSSGRERV
jgi:hypothetical protein